MVSQSAVVRIATVFVASCLMVIVVLYLCGCSKEPIIGDPEWFVLEGKITDASTEMPISGAEIFFNGEKGDDTREDGGYGIILGYVLNRGALLVRAQLYDQREFAIPESATLDSASGKRYVLNVRLERTPGQ